jgi:3D (Asp-Asp-Asp) domain-containing protein
MSGRTIGVDESVIPFGTTVIIFGNEYVAEDRGEAVKGNQIDIYFDDHQEALEFGRKTAEVFVKTE